MVSMCFRLIARDDRRPVNGNEGRGDDVHPGGETQETQGGGGGKAGGGEEGEVGEGEVRTEHQSLEKRESSVGGSHYHNSPVHHHL